MKLSDEQKKLAKACTSLQKKIVINVIGKSMSHREAYIAAGGKAESEQSQDSTVYEILSKLEVKAFYDSLIETAATGAILTKQKALEILTDHTSATMSDFVEIIKEKGKSVMVMKDPTQLPNSLQRCIKSIVPHGDSFKLELYDGHAAMKIMSDMIGWNVPRKTQISGPEDGPIETNMTVTFIEAENKKDGKK